MCSRSECIIPTSHLGVTRFPRRLLTAGPGADHVDAEATRHPRHSPCYCRSSWPMLVFVRPHPLRPGRMLAQAQDAIQRHDVRGGPARSAPAQQRKPGTPPSTGRVVLPRQTVRPGRGDARPDRRRQPALPAGGDRLGSADSRSPTSARRHSCSSASSRFQPDAVEAHRGLADVYFALGAMSLAREEMEAVAARSGRRPAVVLWGTSTPTSDSGRRP